MKKYSIMFAIIALVQSSGPASQGLWASGMRLDVIIAAIPWMLVFCFTNAIMEELWFRGVFLRKLTV